MNEIKATALSLVALLALGACTETQVVDSLGVGKSAPDESQIRINQALSMPPDLRLKTPGTVTSEESGTLNRTTKAQDIKTPPATAAASEDYGTDEPVMTASTDPVATTNTVKTAEAAATATATPAPAPTEQKPATLDDAYQRYGISKTYPNGKPKPDGILYEELRQAQLAAKRAADPKYGTIWNMGDMFKDD